MNATYNEVKTTIKILGIGGAGCNAINKLIPSKMPNWELFALNTDQKSLARSKAPQKIHLGFVPTGSGGNPTTAKLAAEYSAKELKEILKDSSEVFLLAGLGG